MDKAALRQKIRERKRSMTEEEIQGRSEKLRDLFVSSQAYQNANTIYGYLPYNQEVRTWSILQQALQDGKKVAVPKIYGRDMKFIYLEDLTLVEKGYCGIPEPVADAPIAEESDALVLMPGLAFTKAGDRMGYGGGFYDRFLADEPNHPTLALCYEFQIVPSEEYDIPVDTVLWA